MHDSDQNQDSTQVEKVEIVISLNDNIKRVNLTETDSSSGIFEELSLVVIPCIQTVLRLENDVITITYTDFENEDGVEENISYRFGIFTDASN